MLSIMKQRHKLTNSIDYDSAAALIENVEVESIPDTPTHIFLPIPIPAPEIETKASRIVYLKNLNSQQNAIMEGMGKTNSKMGPPLVLFAYGLKLPLAKETSTYLNRLFFKEPVDITTNDDSSSTDDNREPKKLRLDKCETESEEVIMAEHDSFAFKDSPFFMQFKI